MCDEHCWMSPTYPCDYAPGSAAETAPEAALLTVKGPTEEHATAQIRASRL